MLLILTYQALAREQLRQLRTGQCWARHLIAQVKKTFLSDYKHTRRLGGSPLKGTSLILILPDSSA